MFVIVVISISLERLKIKGRPTYKDERLSTMISLMRRPTVSNPDGQPGPTRTLPRQSHPSPSVTEPCRPLRSRQGPSSAKGIERPEVNGSGQVQCDISEAVYAIEDAEWYHRGRLVTTDGHGVAL